MNEIATNAFVHGKPPASIRVWGGDDIVLFEVTDNGSSSADPFGGFLPPVPHQTGCRGLWLSRQPADRLEITTVALGTIARIGVVRVA